MGDLDNHDTHHEPPPTPAPSLTARMCRRVVDSIDGEIKARITSVSRLKGDDSTLLRLDAAPGREFELLHNLRSAWPLCTATLCENVLSGQAENVLYVPNQSDLHDTARARAAHGTLPRALGWLVRVCAAMAIASFAISVALRL